MSQREERRVKVVFDPTIPPLECQNILRNLKEGNTIALFDVKNSTYVLRTYTPNISDFIITIAEINGVDSVELA